MRQPGSESTPLRRHLEISGQVQGVGFRPCVYRVALALGLSGWVRNDAAGVTLEIQGEHTALEAFQPALERALPPLARIDGIKHEGRDPIAEETGFVIVESIGGAVRTGVTCDAALCDDCLSELTDTEDRRYRYPLINCTQCGPRYSITAALPYDRPNTSMAGFTQCPQCQSEYEDPGDRRFHAQPNACSHCGPQLALWSPEGEPIESGDVIAATLARIQAGEILAIKGLGGYHLVCDARNGDAVARLRQRKQREAKPFAVMVANRASLAGLAECDEAAWSRMASAEAPIVLLPKAEGCDGQLPGVAADVGWLGCLRPYTPIQHLLFFEAVGRPAGSAWRTQPQALALVMTSANPGGEPLVIDDAEAVQRLGGIADALVVHDRPILIRCDDSVVRDNGRHLAFMRRARGYTPSAIALPESGPAVLALGAWLKNSLCLTRGDQAYLSQHIGDLDNRATCEALEEAVDHLTQVLEVQPAALAHDLHPEFFSTQLAQRLAAAWSVPAMAVQHHHAHVAGVAAEWGLTQDYLGVALDGVGMGPDGTAWGGELLQVRGADCQRLGHLRELPLPGGDRAAREPWRMALACLHLLGDTKSSHRFSHPGAEMVAQMLERGLNCPPTSSAGRWFDAAAGLLGLCQENAFEAQAAMRLEAAAERYGGRISAGNFSLSDGGVLDLLPLMGELARERDPQRGAARFHATLVAGVCAWVRQAAQTTGVRHIVLSGGCLLNRILASALTESLEQAGLTVYLPNRVPAGDGGISLGQAWVARQRLVPQAD